MSTLGWHDGLVVLAATVLPACSVTPTAYRSGTEIPEGPGIFTGPAGVLRVGPSSALPADAQSPTATDRELFLEFEAFREFRRAREQRSPDYLEFLEWREWVRYAHGKRGGSPGR
jgi:hypothetical protein